MDDIMCLMGKVIIDICSGFDESQFAIFDDDEQTQLRTTWQIVNQDMNKFINILSPVQKQRLGVWAVNRTDYSVDELIIALKKFTKFLESANYENYPKTRRIRNSTIFRSKKKSIK